MGAGGGGGTDNNNGSGGGGGHTGADAGRGSIASSFNSGSNQLNTAGTNGTGSVTGTVTVLCLASLPVELINFKAVLRDNAVELQWSTASEKNNFGFDVERSADNHNWTTLGFVPGHGNTTDRHDYGFVDEKPLAGVNYYRLKQQDYNGKFEYTPIVVADVRATGGQQFDIYPNPSTTGEFSIRTVSAQEGEALLEIYDWVGYKVYNDKLELLKGTMIYPVSMSTFPKGAYTARLEMPDGTVQFRKIVLQ